MFIRFLNTLQATLYKMSEYVEYYRFSFNQKEIKKNQGWGTG